MKSITASTAANSAWSYLPIPEHLSACSSYISSCGYSLWQQTQSLVQTAVSWISEEESPLFIKAQAEPSHQAHLAWKRAFKAQLKELIQAVETHGQQGHWITPDSLGKALIAQQASFEPIAVSSEYFSRQLWKLAKQLPDYASVLNSVCEQWQQHLKANPEQALQHFYQDSVRFLIQMSGEAYGHHLASTQQKSSQRLLAHYQNLVPEALHQAIRATLNTAYLPLIAKTYADSRIAGQFCSVFEEVNQLFASALRDQTTEAETNELALMVEKTESLAKASLPVVIESLKPLAKPTLIAAAALLGVSAWYARSYDQAWPASVSASFDLAIPLVTFAAIMPYSSLGYCRFSPSSYAQHGSNTAVFFMLSSLSQLTYANAQDTASPYWIKTLGGTGTESGKSVSVSSTGDAIVTGYTTSFGVVDYDLLLSRWSANGTLLWARTLGGISEDVGNSVSVTSTGEALVTGYTHSFGAGDYDLWLSRWSANGTLLWARTLGGISEDVGNSVSVTSTGEALVTGYTHSFGAGDYDLWLSRWSANGTLLWARTLGGISEDVGNSVSVTSTGEALVTGYTHSFGAGDYDLWLSRWSANGTLLWARTLGGISEDVGNSVSVTSTGEALVTGYIHSFGAGDYDLWLSRWSANGTLLWARTLGGVSEDVGNSVSVTSTGEALVSGYIHSFGAGDYDLWLSRWSANGTLLWARTLGGISEDVGNSVSVMSTGEAFVTGYTHSFGAGSYDLWLSRWNSQGNTAGSSHCIKSLALQAFDVTNQLNVSVPVAQVNTSSAVVFSPNVTARIVTPTVSPQCNIPPTLSNLGGSFNYTQNAPPMVIDATILIDSVYNKLSGAKVVISAGFAGEQDVLSFSYVNPVLGKYNSTSGILDLAGVGTAFDYQAALRSVTYINLSNNSTTGPRTFTFTVNDNLLISNAISRNATIIAVHAPILVNHALVIGQGQTVMLTSDNLSAYDVDSNNSTLIFKVGNVLQGQFQNQGIQAFSFIASDIDYGYVKFSHDGSLNPPSFNIRVSDGTLETPPISAMITFSLMPSTMPASSSSIVGTTSKGLTTSALSSPAYDSPTPDKNQIVILGAALGGVGGLLLLTGLGAYFVYRKRKQNRAINENFEEKQGLELTFLAADKQTSEIILNKSQIAPNDIVMGHHIYRLELSEQELKQFDQQIRLTSYADGRSRHLVGRGAFGAVYKALARHLQDKAVVCKELINPDEHAIESARNEAQLQQELSELPYLMPLMDQLYLESPVSTLLLFMPAALFSGRDFMALYASLRSPQPLFQSNDPFLADAKLGSAAKDLAVNMLRLKNEMAIHLVMDILNALVSLQDRNEPIVHHDIKPDNILFRQNGEANLADLGCARKELGPIKDYRLGSTLYKPVEQIQLERGETDAVTAYDGLKRDLYAAGLSLLEMLLNTFPLGSVSSREMAKTWQVEQFDEAYSELYQTQQEALPTDLFKFLALLVHPDPQQRPSPQKALAHELFIPHGKCSYHYIRAETFARLQELKSQTEVEEIEEVKYIDPTTQRSVVYKEPSSEKSSAASVANIHLRTVGSEKTSAMRVTFAKKPVVEVSETYLRVQPTKQSTFAQTTYLSGADMTPPARNTPSEATARLTAASPFFAPNRSANPPSLPDAQNLSSATQRL